MNGLLIASVAWVFCGVAVAMMPMRWQFRLVPVLALAAVGVLGMIAMTYGWLVFGLALAAVVSMFRHPLRYVWRRLRGEEVELPPEISAEISREMKR